MKAVWIVDGGYLYSYGRSHPFDYLRLKNELENFNGGPIYESYYLNATRDPVSDSRNAFHDWLKSAPPRGPKMRVQLYRLKELRAECPACSYQYSREVQKGVDVGIATLIVKMAAQGNMIGSSCPPVMETLKMQLPMLNLFCVRKYGFADPRRIFLLIFSLTQIKFFG